MSIDLSTNLAPKNGQKFWLIDTQFGKGGKVELPTFEDLDAIPMANRKYGMWGFDQLNGIWYEADVNLAWIPLEISGGGTAKKQITQAAHGFVKGDVLGYNDTYVKVIANDTDEIEAIGIVSLVTGLDSFELTTAGYITLDEIITYADDVVEETITPNTRYFLSYHTAGRLELNEPEDFGQVKKPVLVTLSATVGIVHITAGQYIMENQEVELGYQVVQKDGTTYPSRNKLNFKGVAVSIEDDSANDRTNITITGQGLGSFSGDVTNGGTDNLVMTIAADSVTNSKMANMPTLTIKGNNTDASADPQDLTVSQVKALLGIASGTTNKLGKFNSTGAELVDSSITDDGESISISYLAGATTRMVTVTSTGILSTATIPSGTVTGTGTSGKLTKFTGTSSIGSSSFITENIHDVTMAFTNDGTGLYLSRTLGAFGNEDGLLNLDGGGLFIKQTRSADYVIKAGYREQIYFSISGNGIIKFPYLETSGTGTIYVEDGFLKIA